MSEETFVSQLKRVLLGKPIPSSLAYHERLSRVTGLAVLSSDCLSSVAYAGEEILRVLVVGGVAAMSYSIPITLVIAVVFAIVTFSYRQTIHAYPTGGGAYIVAKDNLGTTAGLVAAAALLIDYTLTVAVSIAAGVAAITSAIPGWHVNRVEMTLGFMVLIMLANLRGVRESGRIFAVPTYFFVVSMLVMVGMGAWRYFTGTVQPVLAVEPLHHALQPLTTFALLTAFSNGCSAMTGVEAVSNGIPAFRPPEAKHAAQTLVTMAAIAISLVVGTSLLAHAYQVVPSETETVVSQIARGVFGGRHLPYYLLQIGTMLILVLAANTAYADFPRLASVVSRDRFLPRQFMNQGDRLAFSNGIIALSFFAGLLLFVFNGDTHNLIPLYMIGVFLSFTLSQTGMVLHWRRVRTEGWQHSAVINGVGAGVSAIVLVIVTVTKVAEGAWIILLLIPVLVVVFRVTRGHYDEVAAQLSLKGYVPESRHDQIVIVPISGVHRAVVNAMGYARTLSPDVRGVYVSTADAAALAQVRREWEDWVPGVPLVVLESQYRSLLEPLLDYIADTERDRPDAYITVILPEFVPARLWHHLLHNQRAFLIKTALLFRPNVVVTSVPFHFTK